MDAGNDGATTPVLLNVYDLTPVNDYLYWLGFGVFHSGIEVHGMEYGFGAHDFSSSGVFEVESKCCPGFVYRKTVSLGTTDMSREDFRSFIERLAGKYHGNTYNLIAKNCNHFTDDVCRNLTGKPIPGWVNRLARVDDDLDSVSSSDSDEGDEDKHLLEAPSTDLQPVEVPLKLAKDLL
uniref:Uncharacterized protein n=1 Tax=Aegilops tauschii TaxID=37682 RepID=N1R0T5_AEGTA